MRHLRRGAGPLLLAAALLAGAAGAVAAHAQLVASSPTAGEILSSPPEALRLTFSEPLEGSFSSADVVDAEGATLVSRAGAPDPADAYTLVVPLPPLEDGVYSVVWRSLSSADGHPAEGFFSFGVGDVEIGGSVSGQGRSGADPSDPIGLAGKWLGYVAMLLGLGVPLFVVAVLRDDARPRRRLLAGLGWLLVAGGLSLLALAVRIPLVDGDPLGEYLFGSRGGLLALARSGVLLAGGLATVLLSARPSQGVALSASAATALVAVGLHVAGGHAAAAGTPLPVLVQLVHLAAAAIWLSGVLSLTLLATRADGMVDTPVPALRTLVPRFSALALGAIGLVALTGLYAEWTQIGGLPTTDDPYGRALIIKLVVVATALGVGALNYFDGGRNLRRFGGLRPRLLTEAGLALGVLAATALLSTTPPGVTRGIALQARPSASGEVLPFISLSIAPGRPGVNQLAVDISGDIGDLPLDLVLSNTETGNESRISLAGARPGTVPVDHTAHTAPATPSSGLTRYVAGALAMQPETHWDASVVIGTGSGGDLYRQRFTFAIGENGLVDGAAGSLADGALVAGLLLLVGGLLALGLGLGGMVLPRAEAAASRVALLGGGAAAAVTGLAIGVGRLVGSG
ncbi:MAG: copper resistance protein CopC [Chloroflexota bacterium]